MRISEYYKLGRTQPELDFVDVDTVDDTPVFISPKALTMLPSQFGSECVHGIQNFFRTILELIRTDKDDRARTLLSFLREPNETRFGLSKGKARGRAIGSRSAHNVWESLSKSEAAKSGLLEDLEDTVLMIEGIDIDIVSDSTTNIIREPLIRYTQEMCDQYGIPLVPDVDSGPLWDTSTKQWYSKFTPLPLADGEKLLLVPKAIVRTHLQYDSGEYFRHFLLTHMQQVELAANSELVEVIRSGKGKKRKERRRVTKKALVKHYGSGKAAIVRETRKHPQVLEQYRSIKRDEKHLPLTLDDIANLEGDKAPDWNQLLANVTTVRTGRDGATSYEKAVEGLLTALFYPNLVTPVVQHEIHAGRKRIDITYTNMAVNGFFKWFAAHYPAAHIFVECKNYGKEVGNPELDQLSSRFSPSRGKFGLLVCRQFEDKDLFFQRCIDTARDHRGYVIPLDDADLKVLASNRAKEDFYFEWRVLRDRFMRLIDS